MKLSNLLTEGKNGNWWIETNGKPKFLGDSGHEDYLADNGMSSGGYATAFNKGYIRAVTTSDSADFMYAPDKTSDKATRGMLPLVVNKKIIHVDPVKMTNKEKYTYIYTKKMTPEQFKEIFVK